MSAEAAEVLKNRGNQKLRDGHFETAETLYTEAIELDPTNAKYYSNRCTARLRLGKYEDALEDAKMIIQCDSTWIKGYIQKGSVLLALNRYNEAEATLLNAKDLEPSNQTVQALLDKAQNHTGNNQSNRNSNNSESRSSLKSFLIGDSHAILQTAVNIARLIMLFAFISLSFPLFKFQRTHNWVIIFNTMYAFVAIAIIYDNHGGLQFNRRYFQRVTSNLYFITFAYIYIFTIKNNLPIALFPLLIKELVGLCTYSYTILSYLNPSLANKAYGVFDRTVPNLLHIENWNSLNNNEKWIAITNYISMFISLYQLMMILPLIFKISSLNGILTLFMYISYLIQVAALNPSFLMATRTIDYQIRCFLPQLPPILSRAYYFITNWIYKLYVSVVHRA